MDVKAIVKEHEALISACVGLASVSANKTDYKSWVAFDTAVTEKAKAEKVNKAAVVREIAKAKGLDEGKAESFYNVFRASVGRAKSKLGIKGKKGKKTEKTPFQSCKDYISGKAEELSVEDIENLITVLNGMVNEATLEARRKAERKAEREAKKAGQQLPAVA